MNGHDCIVCPYHGWAFDEGGHLRDVPAAENSNEWPKKPLVDSFPVEEKVSVICHFDVHECRSMFSPERLAK